MQYAETETCLCQYMSVFSLMLNHLPPTPTPRSKTVGTSNVVETPEMFRGGARWQGDDVSALALSHVQLINLLRAVTFMGGGQAVSLGRGGRPHWIILEKMLNEYICVVNGNSNYSQVCKVVCVIRYE